MGNADADRAVGASPATVERSTDRALVVARTIRGPAGLVYRAWTQPDLFQQWWVPKEAPISLLACDLDVRVGGTYRLVFGVNGTDQQVAFFGKYLEVTPPNRIVWTNDEGEEGGAVTTVTFEENDGDTRVTVHDLYPSAQALADAIASGSTEGMPAQLEQLDALVAALRGA